MDRELEMSFTKNVAMVAFSLVLAFLLIWWSGVLEAIGLGGPFEYLGILITVLPAWLWAIIILFIAGGIAIERAF